MDYFFKSYLRLNDTVSGVCYIQSSLLNDKV